MIFTYVVTLWTRQPKVNLCRHELTDNYNFANHTDLHSV
jgi:hypothetical protein